MARNLLILNLQTGGPSYRWEAVPVLDMHRDEIQVLQAHQALQWLVHRIDRSALLTPREGNLRTVRLDRVKVDRPFGTQHQVVDTLAT